MNIVAASNKKKSDCEELTCSVQLTLFFRNSTNLSTTPGVFITSSIGGLGSERDACNTRLTHLAMSGIVGDQKEMPHLWKVVFGTSALW